MMRDNGIGHYTSGSRHIAAAGGVHVARRDRSLLSLLEAAACLPESSRDTRNSARERAVLILNVGFSLESWWAFCLWVKFLPGSRMARLIVSRWSWAISARNSLSWSIKPARLLRSCVHRARRLSMADACGCGDQNGQLVEQGGAVKVWLRLKECRWLCGAV